MSKVFEFVKSRTSWLLNSDVHESLFLQLIPKVHHCILNETYMFFLQISSCEIIFS